MNIPLQVFEQIFSFLLGKYFKMWLVDHMIYTYEGCICSLSGFLNRHTGDILGWILLCLGGFTMHFGHLVASLATTYMTYLMTLVAFFPQPSCDNPNWIGQMFPRGQKSPPVESHCSIFSLTLGLSAIELYHFSMCVVVFHYGINLHFPND